MTYFGIAWYKKEQWDELRRVSQDPEALEDTWKEWADVAEKRIIDIMRAGGNVRKVPVDVHDLVLWCRTQNRPVDGEARAAYVTSRLQSP